MSQGAAPSDFEPNLCLQSGLEQICLKDTKQMFLDTENLLFI